MHSARTLSILGVLAIAACAESSVQPVALKSVGTVAFSSEAAGGETYLVQFKGHKIPDDFSASVSALGGEVIFAHAGAGVAAVSGINDDAAATLAARTEIAAVDADAYTVLDDSPVTAAESATAPESPSAPTLAAFYGRQWNMDAVHAPDAWNAGKKGKASVKVGILDTGIDYLHPDLIGRVDMVLSRSFLSAAENARVPAGANLIADLNYHGTHVASTIASNAYLAAGITTEVTLVALKVCAPGTPANGFQGTCPTSGTLSAILYAADNGLDVINMSLGGAFLRREASARGGFAPSFLATINRVFNYANSKGTAIVVSAGNSALDMDHDGNVYNAYCSAAAVICVSATGPTSAGVSFDEDPLGEYVNIQNIDALAFYSNFGRSSVSVAAPGGNAIPVWAACSGFTLHPALASCHSRFFTDENNWSGSVVGLSGTSMAAPHVTGLAALIAGEVGHNPSQIAARLKQTADDLGQPGTDPAYGKGRINVARGAGVN